MTSDRRRARRLGDRLAGVVIGLGLLLAALGTANGESLLSVLFGRQSMDNGPILQDGTVEEWVLLFSDEFDEPQLDGDKWTPCYWWDDHGCTNEGNDELEWYKAKNVSIRDGALILRAEEERIRASDGDTYDYTSGMVTTGRSRSDLSARLRFAFRYGYAEIRARVPSGQGLWPAFWLLPTDHNSKPEIDVMEILGHEPDVVQMHFHYMNEEDRRSSPGKAWQGPDFSRDWHRFAIDWQPDAIVWYVDGVERWRFDDADHIPDKPMYLLLNLAVGGDWPGAPDDSTVFPSEFKVDYIKVWRRYGDSAS